MRLWAGLRQNTAPRQKSPRARATVYAESAGNRTTTPRRKAGSFYDRADGSGSGRAAEQTAGSTGTAGRAAPGSAQAGGCGSGICRRLGRCVRCTDAFWSGLCAGLCRGLLCPLCGGCGAGCAAARVWGTLAAQCLYAVRTGCCSGSAVDGCQNTDPGGTGGLRHAGGRGAVLCLWRRRGRAGALQCSRCPAGRSHGLLSAAVCARKAGCRDASGGCGHSGGAGQCAAVAAAAGRDRLRGTGTVFMQQRAGQSRACGLCGAGRCAVRGRPGPQLCGIRPCLCHGGSGGAGTWTAHGNGSRLRGRLRDRCTLCAAARERVSISAERLHRHHGRSGHARSMACAGAGRKAAGRAGPAAAVQCSGHPAGTGVPEPCIAGRDRERCLRNLAAPA